MKGDGTVATFARKAGFWMLALIVLTYTTDVPMLAKDEEGPVSNVRVSKQGKINVFIEYDLAGDPDELYTVSLRVKLASDTSFTYTPVNVIGDVGANVRPGKNRRISWRTSDEYIPALDRDRAPNCTLRAVPAFWDWRLPSFCCLPTRLSRSLSARFHSRRGGRDEWSRYLAAAHRTRVVDLARLHSPQHP